ncbi:MAG: universal stress protein [Rhodanobacteraceae bacterium]
MYSTLMVHLDLDDDNVRLLNITGDLAERFDADVIGIAACQTAMLIIGDGVGSAEIVDRDQARIKKKIGDAENAFREALQHRSPHLEWRSTESFGAPTEYIARQMRSADLLITGVNCRGSWLDPTRRVDTGGLVMQAGRPILIVPKAARQLLAKTILVGWKDTRETRRAVSDALPFLKTAKRVIVVEVVANERTIGEGRENVKDVAGWLERHDIPAEPLALSADDAFAPALGVIAHKEGADLIVAGAYGHTRLREWVLGGVTRNLLLDTNLCSLLSH